MLSNYSLMYGITNNSIESQYKEIFSVVGKRNKPLRLKITQPINVNPQKRSSYEWGILNARESIKSLSSKSLFTKYSVSVVT